MREISWKRNLAAIWLGQLLSMAGTAMTLPFIPIYMRVELGIVDDGARAMATSLFFSLGMLSFCFSNPIWGALGDRYGRKLMLLRAYFITAVTFPAMYFMPSVGWLLAMRFIAHNPNVTVTIPGMAEKKELDQNVAAYCDKAPLTPEELDKIEKIRSELGNNFCRRCGYCAPCTVGIGIPAALVAEGYHLRYGLESYAMARYEASGAAASNCVDCGLCEERCPYHLPIRQMLKRVAETFGK